MNWIYLKSDNPADALALATVISYSNDSYGIVRRTVNSFFFKGLKNVTIDFYPDSEENNLTVIHEISTDSWFAKYDILAERLNIKVPRESNPYLGFCANNTGIVKQWGDDKNILLYLFPHPDQKIDLMIVDLLVRQFEQKGIKSVSGGTIVLPCIKGTKDLRQLIDLSVLCSIKDKICFILTTEKSIKALGEALGINVYVISHISELMLDDIPMSDSNQMANYIVKNSNKN